MPADFVFASTGKTALSDSKPRENIRYFVNAQFRRKCVVGGLYQDLTIREYYGWHDPMPVIDSPHKCHAFLVLLNINLDVFDSLFIKEMLDSMAIWTPAGGINNDYLVICSIHFY
jgi:hypothetical protein